MNYTPAPWKVVATPLNTTVRTVDENYTICTLNYQADEIFNSRLIAKAPEMFELLKLTWDRTWGKGLPGSGNSLQTDIENLLKEIIGDE